jgi:hypothetical protein
LQQFDLRWLNIPSVFDEHGQREIGGQHESFEFVSLKLRLEDECIVKYLGLGQNFATFSALSIFAASSWCHFIQ